MNKKAEKAWFDEQWGLMITHLKAFIKTGDQEELHIFRIQVKKIRAMLTLLDTASPKQKLSKYFKPVKIIFRLGGNIRNAYINLQLGTRYDLKNEDFMMGQLYEIEKGTSEFKEQGKKYLKTIKLAYQTISNNLKAIDNEQIVEFYKINLEQIILILANPQFGEDLHDCRKQIKILLYNRKIAFKALDGKLLLDYVYLDKIQDVIGNWHDNSLALELLSVAGINDKAIISRIKRQSTRLKRSITILIRGFSNRVILPLPVNENDK